MKLYLKLHDKFLIPKSQVNDIFENIFSIIKISNENTIDFLTKCKEENSDEQVLNIFERSLKEGDSLYQNAHKKLRHESAKKKWLEKSGFWVEPVEMVLPYNDKLNGVTSFQYIPILLSLKAMLSKEDILEKVLSISPEKDSSVIRSFKDGSRFKNSAFFQNNPNALQLIVYSDDYQLYDPCKDNRNHGKTNGTYWKLG